jgi:hypothetical protein
MVTSATGHNEEMVQLLKSLRETVGDTDRKRIDDMLTGVGRVAATLLIVSLTIPGH